MIAGFIQNMWNKVKTGWAIYTATEDIAAGNWETARQTLLALETGDPRKNNLLAQTYVLEADEVLGAGRVEQAWKVFQQAHFYNPSAWQEPLLTFCLKIVQSDISSREAATLLERALERQSRSANPLPEDQFRQLKAHAGYVFAVNGLSGDPYDDAVRFTLEDYSQQIRDAQRAGQVDRVSSIGTRIVRMNPDDTGAMDLLARAQFQLGRLHEAIRWSRELATRTGAPEPAFKLAWLLAHAKRYEEALAALDPFPLSSYRNPGKVLALKAFCLWEMGHVDKAQQACLDGQAPSALRTLAAVMDIARGLEPREIGPPVTRHPIELIGSALAEYWKGNYSRAADRLHRVPTGPWQKRALLLRALSLTQAGHMAEAHAALNTPVLEWNARADLLRGLVALRLGRYDKAVAAWETASERGVAAPRGWIDGAAFLDVLERFRTAPAGSVLVELPHRDWPEDLIDHVKNLQAAAAWRFVISSVRSGRVKEALPALPRLGPLADTPQGHVIKQFLALARGESVDALLDPGSYKEHHQFIAAQSALRRGKLTEGEALLRELEKVPAFSSAVSHLRAQGWLLSGNMQQASAEMRRVGLASPWVIGCRLFLGEETATPEAAQQLAPAAASWATMWRQSNPEGATRLIQQLSQGAKAPAEWKRLGAAIRLHEALDALDRDEDPRRYLEELLRDTADPSIRSEALNLMGVHAFRQGDAAQARSYFVQAAPTTPDGKRHARINRCVALALTDHEKDSARAWMRLLNELQLDLLRGDALVRQRVLLAARRTAVLARAAEEWKILQRAAEHGLSIDGTDLFFAGAGYEALLHLDREHDAARLIDAVAARLHDPIPLRLQQVEIDWFAGRPTDAIDRLSQLLEKAPANPEIQALRDIIVDALLREFDAREEQRTPSESMDTVVLIHLLTLALKLEPHPRLSAFLLYRRALLWLEWTEQTHNPDGIMQARSDAEQALGLTDDPKVRAALRELAAVLNT